MTSADRADLLKSRDTHTHTHLHLGFSKLPNGLPTSSTLIIQYSYLVDAHTYSIRISNATWRAIHASTGPPMSHLQCRPKSNQIPPSASHSTSRKRHSEPTPARGTRLRDLSKPRLSYSHTTPPARLRRNADVRGFIKRTRNGHGSSYQQ